MHHSAYYSENSHLTCTNINCHFYSTKGIALQWTDKVQVMLNRLSDIYMKFHTIATKLSLVMYPHMTSLTVFKPNLHLLWTFLGFFDSTNEWCSVVDFHDMNQAGNWGQHPKSCLLITIEDAWDFLFTLEKVTQAEDNPGIHKFVINRLLLPEIYGDHWLQLAGFTWYCPYIA